MPNKFTGKPNASPISQLSGRYEEFNLRENPFPSEPMVNKDSDDQRINGDIYEIGLRENEHEQILNYFLKISQNDPNHLRLGYIIDTSYIGRGNGKSAFLIHLLHEINQKYALDISDGTNKCFALYVTPEPGGRSKTFGSFVDLVFQSIISSNIIQNCAAILRLNGILEAYPHALEDKDFEDEDELISNLNDEEWFKTKGINLSVVREFIQKNQFLQQLPPDFPLFTEINKHTLFPKMVTSEDFIIHYNEMKKGKPRIDFVFSHLVRFFQAADFNGAYILVDDFERIPDFQSSRQKRDFALELRSVLFDGVYQSAKFGFYNLLLVLHAGVPRLIDEAWQESGMEARSPISEKNSNHVIPFEKLNKNHTLLLLKKYMDAYRLNESENNIEPFTIDGVERIGETSEYNAAQILRTAYRLLDLVARDKSNLTQGKIDKSYVDQFIENDKECHEKEDSITIGKSKPADLRKKAEGSS
ncbi:hypothetical protein [Gimesia sp.]|uniref:hypothetical protein n=1 Tax=Gimesia sp. TaxID=2024833 RepID=UPI003A952751